ncbi:methyltransferase [uncultured Methylobacterium sp.]|jgi:tRNA1(Val) A37 N6-methylase TrmN6|uniref:tRNA1(Val) (adenine(37)-N6)-methyltransferase n=1 Tax=uncultured Methylobacterium sp. TaxID=157278 RepID=UPI00260A3B27|nr:methyltransferase [uncultured Methylobacterium sp.]
MSGHPEADGSPEPWFGGRLRLCQPARGGHRAGTDAVLLAAFAGDLTEGTICDLGAGTGAAGLAAALDRPGCRLVLVERDPDAAALARANLALNGLADRGRVIEADLLAPGRERRAQGLEPEAADLVLTNPPFFEAGTHRASPVAAKASAHTFPAGGLDGWLRACADVLRPRGRLVLIHRADALPACLAGLERRFGGVGVRPVQPRAGAPATRVVIAAVKGSRAGFGLEAPLVLHGPDGRFTAEAEALHRGVVSR